MEYTVSTTEQSEGLLDRLEAILDRQIDMARTNDFRGIETATEETRLIITEIAEKELLQQPHLKDRCNGILKRYESLTLILNANKETVAKQLSKVGKGKKTMQAYRHRS